MRDAKNGRPQFADFAAMELIELDEIRVPVTPNFTPSFYCNIFH